MLKTVLWKPEYHSKVWGSKIKNNNFYSANENALKWWKIDTIKTFKMLQKIYIKNRDQNCSVYFFMYTSYSYFYQEKET